MMTNRTMTGLRPAAASVLLAAVAVLALAWQAAPAGAADPTASSAAPAAPTAATSADIPRHGVVESEKGAVLVGEVTREDVVKLQPAWQDSARAYRPDSTAVAMLAAVEKPVEITLIFGTWCSDSRREVPRFWTVLERAHNPNLQLTMIAVGRKDDAAAEKKLVEIGLPKDLRAQYALTAVPTFIFSQGGAELGRISESPAGTLEGDAAGFLAAKPAPAGQGSWH
jgi:hypothetical protein